jgi:hypothetical protein
MSGRSATTSHTPHPDEFVRLLEQHAGILRKVSAAYSRSPADALDLMQEIRRDEGRAREPAWGRLLRLASGRTAEAGRRESSRLLYRSSHFGSLP